MTDRITPILLWVLAVLFFGCLVHLASILVLPRLAPDDAYARIAADREAGAVAVLPRASSRQNSIPFRDAAMASAICRYDLDKGPMRIGTSVNGAGFVAVSFHSRYGLPFYGLTDRSAINGRLDVILMSPAQREKAEAADAEDEPMREVRVTAPSTEGFVEFDMLALVGGYAAAEQALESATCTIVRNL